jgi:hypothetical protein
MLLARADTAEAGIRSEPVSRRDVGVRYANAGVLGEHERQKAIPEGTGLAGGQLAEASWWWLRCVPVRHFSRRGTVCANFFSRRSSQVTLPITRQMNSSPGLVWVNRQGSIRESAHVINSASGRWPMASFSKRS